MSSQGFSLGNSCLCLLCTVNGARNSPTDTDLVPGAACTSMFLLFLSGPSPGSEAVVDIGDEADSSSCDNDPQESRASSEHVQVKGGEVKGHSRTRTYTNMDQTETEPALGVHSNFFFFFLRQNPKPGFGTHRQCKEASQNTHKHSVTEIDSQCPYHSSILCLFQCTLYKH